MDDLVGRAPLHSSVEELGRGVNGRQLEEKIRKEKMSLSLNNDKSDPPQSKRQIDLKNEDEADALSIAKDRGQVTMTSAMSMTNIALLKAVLDRGPDTSRFYTVLLVLTCLVLGLQILAGILSLCVSQLRNYYQKFHNNVKPRIQCCPISLQWRTENDDDCNCDCCCPCDIELVSHFYKDYELNVIDAWKDWVEEDTEHDMNAAEANIMLDYLEGVITVSRERLGKVIGERKDSENDRKEELEGEIGRLKADIANAYKRKAVYTKVNQEADGSNAKGNVLSTAMHDITRNHTLKRAQTWQYVINVMLYCSFIISAFLTGLGLAS